MDGIREIFLLQNLLNKACLKLGWHAEAEAEAEQSESESMELQEVEGSVSVGIGPDNMAPTSPVSSSAVQPGPPRRNMAAAFPKGSIDAQPRAAPCDVPDAILEWNVDAQPGSPREALSPCFGSVSSMLPGEARQLPKGGQQASGKKRKPDTSPGKAPDPRRRHVPSYPLKRMQAGAYSWAQTGDCALGNVINEAALGSFACSIVATFCLPPGTDAGKHLGHASTALFCIRRSVSFLCVCWQLCEGQVRH